MRPGTMQRHSARDTGTWQRVRAVKEMDSKSIGLCPQGFESPRYRFFWERRLLVSIHGPVG